VYLSSCDLLRFEVEPGFGTEVMLHLKPLTRDETFGLPMITVGDQGSRGHC